MKKGQELGRYFWSDFYIDKNLEQHVESTIISQAVSVHEQPHSHNLDKYNNGLSSKGGRPVPIIVQQYQSVGLYLSADTWNSLRGYELKKNTLNTSSSETAEVIL